jgi:hypothetical protein
VSSFARRNAESAVLPRKRRIGIKARR